MEAEKKRFLLEQLKKAKEHTMIGGLSDAVEIHNQVLESIVHDLGPSAHAEAVSNLRMPSGQGDGSGH